LVGKLSDEKTAVESRQREMLKMSRKLHHPTCAPLKKIEAGGLAEGGPSLCQDTREGAGPGGGRAARTSRRHA